MRPSCTPPVLEAEPSGRHGIWREAGGALLIQFSHAAFDEIRRACFEHASPRGKPRMLEVGLLLGRVAEGCVHIEEWCSLGGKVGPELELVGFFAVNRKGERSLPTDEMVPHLPASGGRAPLVLVFRPIRGAQVRVSVYLPDEDSPFRLRLAGPEILIGAYTARRKQGSDRLGTGNNLQPARPATQAAAPRRLNTWSPAGFPAHRGRTMLLSLVIAAASAVMALSVPMFRAFPHYRNGLEPLKLASLHVTRTATATLVDWDASAPRVQSAAHGLLRLESADLIEEYVLSSEDLKRGQTTLSAVSEPLTVHLKVKTKEGPPATESTRLPASWVQ